jgi:hypothetical protein
MVARLVFLLFDAACHLVAMLDSLSRTRLWLESYASHAFVRKKYYTAESVFCETEEAPLLFAIH